MTQKIITFILLLFIASISMQAQTLEEMKEKILKEYENKSKEEIEEMIITSAKELKEGLEMMKLIQSTTFSQTSQDMGEAGTEEHKDFTLPKGWGYEAFAKNKVTQSADSLDTKIYIGQLVAPKQSKIVYTIENVYLTDGTTLTPDQDEALYDYELSEYKHIDSITVTVGFIRPSAFAEVKLSASDPQAIVNDDTIKLTKLENNLVRIESPFSLSHMLLQAEGITKTGGYTTHNSSSTGTVENDQMIEFMPFLAESFDEVVLNIEQKKYNERQEIIDDLFVVGEKILNKSKSMPDKHNNYWQATFKANVDTLLLYLATENEANNYTCTYPVTLSED